MTETQKPPRPDSGVARKIFIVKADDFSRGPVLDRWRKFIDLSIEAGVVPSIGVVGSDFSVNAPARALARFAADSYGCEFWNHSNAHADLRAMTSGQRTQDTALCHAALADAIGVAPIAYGAPFNFIDADCARDVAAAAPYRLLFDEAAGGSGAWELPRDWYASPEVRTQAFRPVRFPKFAAAMRRQWADGASPPAVLQIHPSCWSDDCFDEYAKTLQFLAERGYEHFTATQLADYLDAGRRPERPRLTLGAAARAVRETGADFPLMRLAAHLRRFPIRDPRENPDVEVALAEIGQSEGRWALTACAAFAGVRATVITARPDESARAAGAGFVDSGALRFAAELPEAPRFDVFVVDDPQAPWEETLGDVARVLRVSGRALIRRRSEIALLADLVDASRRRERERALAALEAIARLAGRRLAVVAPAGAPNYLNDFEFSTLAVYAGLQPQLRLPGSRLEPARFHGASLVVEDLLICTASSKLRAKALAPGAQATTDDLAALTSAGATATLKGMTDGESLERLAPAARLALLVALGEAAPAAGDAAADFHEFSQAVHAEGWREAADLAARGLPVSPTGRDILSWLSGDRPAALQGDLLSGLLRIGARLRDGDDAFADLLAEFLPSRRLEGLLQEVQAGASPDNVYPFVD